MLKRSALTALALIAFAASLAAPLQRAAAADAVTVQLDWVVRGNHAMFFVGKGKGIFAKNGIDLTEIRKGTGSPDAMRLVGNGNADFGFGDLPTLAVARSQGVPVVAVTAVNQHSPLAMMSLAKTVTLKAPADLKGLTVGIHPAGSTYIFFKALLAANGLTENDMTINSVSPPYESYLLLGRVQTVAGYVDAEVPELEAKAGGPGSLSIMMGSDFGWSVYGSGLFASEKAIADKPDLVGRFVKSYKEAFDYVAAHPEEAAEITAKAAPGYAEKKDVLLAQIKADIASTFMRHPVSTPDFSGCNFSCGAVLFRVVKGLVLPGFPEDAEPGAGEDTDGVRVLASALTGSAIDVCCPGRGMSRVVGEAGDGLSEVLVTGPSEHDAAAFAGGVGDGTDAGLGGELIFGGEALADVAEFGQDRCCADASGAGEGHDDLTVGQVGHGVLDARGQLGDLADEAFEDGDERAGDLALGVGLCIAGEARGRGLQPGQEFGGRSAPAIGVLGHEAGEALFAETAGAVGRGIAADEGERDRAVDGGEDGGGARPEALEQAAELVGQGNALVDQVAACAHQGPQRPDVVGGRQQRAESVTVGAQDVGQHEGVARIALAAGGAVARPAGFDDVGVDRDDGVPGLDQGVDDQTRRPLNGDRQVGRWSDALELGRHVGQPCRIVADLKADDDLTGAVDDAKGMACAAPVQTPMKSHSLISSACVSFARAGRSCGSLTDRRSGWRALALHPVVRPGLPAPAVRLVSCGPSSGKRRRPSRQGLGLADATPLDRFAPANPKVHQ